MKYVISLNKDREKLLSNLMRSSELHRTRQRAHAIILSSKHYSVESISSIFDVHRDTVSRWIDEWNESGPDGLYDAPKPGRPKNIRKKTAQIELMQA